MRVERTIKPVVIRVGQSQHLRFRKMGIKDSCYVRSLLDEDLSDREFTIEVLHNQIWREEVAIELLHQWPGDFLLWVAFRWLTRSQKLTSPFYSLAAFRTALSEYLDDEYMAALDEAKNAHHRWLDGMNLSHRAMSQAFKPFHPNTLGNAFASMNKALHPIGGLANLHKYQAINTAEIFGRASRVRMAADAVAHVTSPLNSVAIAAGISQIQAMRSTPPVMPLGSVTTGPALVLGARLSTLPPITTALSRHAARAATASENVRMMPLAPISSLAAIIGTGADWTDSVRRLQIGPAWTAGLTAKTLSQHWNTILGPLHRILEAGDFYSQLFQDYNGQFQKNIRRWQEMAALRERAEILLIECGFGFLIPLLTFSTLMELLSFAAAKTKQALVARRILAITRSREFEDDFISELEKSKRLGRRAEVISGSFQLHLEGKYKLSIPLLYKEFEGLYTELMRLLGMAGCKKGKKGKFYAKEKNGNFKLSGKSNVIELNGLHNKAKYSRFEDHPRMERVPDFIQEDFTQSRNGVLHGTLVNYGTAKKSTQLVFLVFLVAREINRLEYAASSQAA